jgi:hypothetical protein
MLRKRLARILPALLSTGIMLMTCNASATLNQWWNLKPDAGSGNFDWTYETFHDFSLSPYGSNGSVKTLALAGQNASTVGHCIELETTSSTNADTRIWLFDGSTYHNINDDFGGTHQSKARFWMLGSGLDYVIHVRSFAGGVAYDNMTFFLNVTRRDISEAACTTGQAVIPWAKMKRPGGIANYGTITYGNGAG